MHVGTALALITHVIHVLGMYYMSCSCITWVSIPIMDPCNAWVPMYYMGHLRCYMKMHIIHAPAIGVT